MWRKKCRAHVEEEDSTLLKEVIRDVEGSKGRLWDQRQTLKCSSGQNLSAWESKKGRNTEEERFEEL